MKISLVSALFIILATSLTMFSFSSFAFADYSDITVETTIGSGEPGCEETSQSCYIPSIAKVDVGYAVIFSNTDSTAHTFTAGTPSGGSSGEFDSGLVKAGKSYQWLTTEVGDQPYFCVFHPWMVGLIMVEGNVVLPSSISVFTDALSYDGKEHIKIYGKVTNPTGSTRVDLTIVSSNGVLVDKAKISMVDGFSRIVIPEDPLWKEGTYVVTAQYRSENISVTTSFDFNGFVKTGFDKNGFAIVLEDEEKYVNEEIFENNVGEGQGNIGSEYKSESVQNDYLSNIESGVHIDPDVWGTNNDLNLVKQNEKKIDELSKQLDGLSAQLDVQTQKITSFDSKIQYEQSQLDEYYKMYDYYDGKTLSQHDEQKFQKVIGKLNSQIEKINSLIDDRNLIVLQSNEVIEIVEEKPTTSQSVKQIQEKPEKEISCFLFWCW